MKKAIAKILGTAMILTMMGCGSGETNNGATTDTASSTTTEVTTEITTEATTEDPSHGEKDVIESFYSHLVDFHKVCKDKTYSSLAKEVAGLKEDVENINSLYEKGDAYYQDYLNGLAKNKYYNTFVNNYVNSTKDFDCKDEYSIGYANLCDEYVKIILSIDLPFESEAQTEYKELREKTISTVDGYWDFILANQKEGVPIKGLLDRNNTRQLYLLEQPINDDGMLGDEYTLGEDASLQIGILAFIPSSQFDYLELFSVLGTNKTGDVSFSGNSNYDTINLESGQVRVDSKGFWYKDTKGICIRLYDTGVLGKNESDKFISLLDMFFHSDEIILTVKKTDYPLNGEAFDAYQLFLSYFELAVLIY